MDNSLNTPKPLYLAAVAFILGIIVADHFTGPSLTPVPSSPFGEAHHCEGAHLRGGSPHILYITFFTCVIALTVFYFARLSVWRIVIILVLCFLGGMIRLRLAAELPNNHVVKLSVDNKSITLEGVVAEEPVLFAQRDNRWRGIKPDEPSGFFILRVARMISEGQAISTCGLVRVRFDKFLPEIKYGDDIKVSGSISAPAPPTNWGEFDYKQHLERQGIYRIIRCTASHQIEVIRQGQGNPILRLFYNIRRVVSDKIDTAFSQMPADITAFSKAMFLGDRTGFPDDLEDKFIRTGTVHFISVSGAHLAIVAGIFFILCAWLGIIGRTRLVILLGASILYAGITGLYTPISRALIMLICYFGAEIFNRKPNAINSLALAALIIALYNPYEAFSAGTQLSFISVLFIVVFTPGLLRLLVHKPPTERTISDLLPPTLIQRLWQAVKQYLINVFAVSVVAWTGLILLVLYYFNIINPIAIIANIILSFLITVLMFSGFITLPFLWVIPDVPVAVLTSLTWYIYRIIEWFSRVPAASFYLPDIPGWFVALFYCLFFAGILIIRIRNIGITLFKYVTAILGVMIAATVIWVITTLVSGRSPLYKPPDGLALTMLDVRQGASFVMETPDNKVILYDAGSQSRSDIGRTVIGQFLWHKGISRIDTVILSHPHSDHINGMPTLVDRFKINQLVLSPYFKDNQGGGRLLGILSKDTKVVEVYAGQAISLDKNIKADVLSPSPQQEFNDSRNWWNNSSIVLRVKSSTSGKADILLAGDIERSVIDWLMTNQAQLSGIAVLQLPHHGFVSSFHSEFIRAVSPRYALINNIDKRLAKGLLELCRDSRINVLSSYQYGALTITLTPSGQVTTTFYDSAVSSGEDDDE